ncbi:MAG: cobalamin-dependent protein [Syntrophorhabdaceae bacterium]|nr:cobalamin-dependent protein [Syntrophorhabdaceae bacterium]
MVERRKKIVLAKLGLDGHDNGIRIIAKWLMDEGYEVIYAGLYNKPERVIDIAVEESADAIGMSFQGGGHLYYAKRIIDLMKKRNIEGIKVIVGGVIPPFDVEELKRTGVHEVFTPGARKQVILERIASLLS